MTHEARSSCGMRTVYLSISLEVVPPPEHGGSFTEVTSFLPVSNK